MANRSRYADTKPFVFDAGEGTVFRGRRAREIGAAAGVLEHTWKSTDRLDLLALDYSGDASKWWRILDANPDVLCGLELAQDAAVGTVILIPAAEDAGGRS
jgi:hypothetical protein